MRFSWVLKSIGIEATVQAEHDVLGDGQRVHQHEVLMDHADAVRDGVARRGQSEWRAIERNRPSSG